MLLAAAKITGNSTYKAEGLRWCDAFVAKQLPITTSTGKPAGYWDTVRNHFLYWVSPR